MELPCQYKNFGPDGVMAHKAIMYAEKLASNQSSTGKTLWSWNQPRLMAVSTFPLTFILKKLHQSSPNLRAQEQGFFHPNQDEKTPLFSPQHNARI